MKILNNILKYLTLVLSLAGFVLFFTNFVSYNLGASETHYLAGAQMAFGGKTDLAINIAVSAKITFCMILSGLGLVASIYNTVKNSAASRWVTIVTNGVSGVYMLVVALSSPWTFFDFRPLVGMKNVEYTIFVLFTAIAILASFLFCIAHQLTADAIATKASGKLPLLKRIAKYFREYKSETKKIVWPKFKTVVKNTLIVLVMCAIFGVIVWALDYGLGALVNLLTK